MAVFCLLILSIWTSPCYYKIVRFAVLFWANLVHGFGIIVASATISEPRVTPFNGESSVSNAFGPTTICALILLRPD
jgi:hypothetical protein